MRKPFFKICSCVDAGEAGKAIYAVSTLGGSPRVKCCAPSDSRKNPALGNRLNETGRTARTVPDGTGTVRTGIHSFIVKNRYILGRKSALLRRFPTLYGRF